MNELIKVKVNENQEPVISGRELHKFLEVKTAYKDWMPRMIEYGFAEEIDFCSILSESTGGRPKTDHIIKLDMAKELSMIQRTERGKQARKYFISVEKEFNSPEKVMARALKIADDTINNLRLENKVQQQQIQEFKPKATYYDLVLQNKDLISMSAIAKDYGKSATAFNKLLNELGVQYKQGKIWLLYQNYADKGYTSTKTHVYSKSGGDVGTSIHTYWTQQGRLFIYHLLKKEGILPLIEQMN